MPVGSSKSAPSLGPEPVGRCLYEVTSGLVVLRPEPHTRSAGLGSIRGGIKFFAFPEKIGNQTWLKLQTEHVTPPMFSPSKLGPPQENLKNLGKDMRGLTVYKPEPGRAYRHRALAKGLHLYRDSVPHALHQHDQTALLEAANLYIRFDDKCLQKLRDSPDPWGLYSVASHGAPGPAAPSASDDGGSPVQKKQALDLEIADFQHRLDAKEREMDALSPTSCPGISSPQSMMGTHSTVHEINHWAGYGRGAWMSFGRYGVTGLPRNDNCGRWRQMGSESGWPVPRATRDMYPR